MDSSSISSSSSSELASPTVAFCLTTSQQASLNELKRLCGKDDVYWHVNGVRRSNDEATLLRYLRARDFQPQAAFKQYSATVTWRKKIKLDELYRTADVDHFEATRRLFPTWTGRLDRRGIPLFAYRVAHVSTADLLSTSTRDPSLSSVFLPAEYATQFVQPLCSQVSGAGEGSVSSAIYIVDLTGVGVGHFWNMRKHLQKVGLMATAHYPESVDKIFVVGAPSFFPTIFGYISKWFGPALTSKISVLSVANAYKTLTEYIDPASLPCWLGGTHAWEYGQHPDLDAVTRRQLAGQLVAENWVEGPLKAVNDVEGMQVVTLGATRKEVVVGKLIVEGAEEFLSEDE